MYGKHLVSTAKLSRLIDSKLQGFVNVNIKITFSPTPPPPSNSVTVFYFSLEKMQFDFITLTVMYYGDNCFAVDKR